MCASSIVIDITGKSIMEVVTDAQILFPTSCLLGYCLEVIKKEKFTSSSVIISAKEVSYRLDSYQERDVKSFINQAIEGLIGLNLSISSDKIKIISMIENVTNFGNQAVKVTFSEDVFELLRNEDVEN